MKPPIYVRKLTEEEDLVIDTGLRSKDATWLRRCQIIRMSAEGKPVSEIAGLVGCCRQTVRNLLHSFNGQGVAALQPGSRRRHTSLAAFDADGIEQLRDLLHHSPRDYGKSTSLWTLELVAEACFEKGITAQRVSGETVRATLKRIGIRWKRAKHWITSPDPGYERKKSVGIG
jgi:transposase